MRKLLVTLLMALTVLGARPALADASRESMPYNNPPARESLLHNPYVDEIKPSCPLVPPVFPSAAQESTLYR